jgi:hypothetical protein
MAKNENPFAIRKSPVELITAQTLTLDDYVKRHDRHHLDCSTNVR